MSTQRTPEPIVVTSAPTKPEPGLSRLNHGTLLEGLFHRAAATMNQEELRHLSRQASMLAEESSRRASAVAEGVGCMIMDDVDAPYPSGHFQTPQDASLLLWHFSDVFSSLSGLVSVAREAASAAEQVKP